LNRLGYCTVRHFVEFRRSGLIKPDSIIEVNGSKYLVSDIDGSVIVAIGVKNGLKRRFNSKDLGMTSTDGAEDKRQKFIEERIKLRDYREN
jgi:hypothetical protein